MRITPPERGQPLDISYLYQIANSINELSNQITSSNTTSVVDNKINTNVTTSTTNNLRFYATTKTLTTGNISAGTSEEWSINFDPPFNYIPIVTATIKNNSGSAAGDNVVVTVNQVTTGLVKGKVRYNTAGSIDIDINIIAIGIAG